MSEGRRRQEIPTHLEVEDRILFGLTLRQGVWLLLGVAAGYFVYAQSGHLSWPGTNQSAVGGHLPLVLQIVLGLLPGLCALAVALLQPAGRPLEDWLFAYVRYVTLPKRYVWRSHATDAAPRSHDEVMQDERIGEPSEVGIVTAMSTVTAVTTEQWE